jgi:Flp pilus assembly pilin Flp
VFTWFKRIILEEEGQDSAEYVLIPGAVGVVSIAVITASKPTSRRCAWREADTGVLQ